MDESYSDANATEPTARERALVHDVLALLVPSADAALLTRALLAEHRSSPPNPLEEAATAELKRVRRQLASGEASRLFQHALNNPLTALLAETQMLEMEPLAEESHAAVVRVLDLTRRLVALTRTMDAAGSERVG